jgi:hypothetical protein
MIALIRLPLRQCFHLVSSKIPSKVADNWTMDINLADDQCLHDWAIHVLDAVRMQRVPLTRGLDHIIEVVAGRFDRDLAVCSEHRVAP